MFPSAIGLVAWLGVTALRALSFRRASAKCVGFSGQLRSWIFQEPQIEGREHQDNSDVHCQPLPESVSEEKDVHADHEAKSTSLRASLTRHRDPTAWLGM
jgi:hypothetical protein